MASLSPEYILDDVQKDKTPGDKDISALKLALYSAVGGSTDPLLMVDKKDAKKRPVLFERLVNSWN